MGFLIALRFLTILPLFKKESTAKELGGSIGYFPLVGLLLGLALLGLDRGLGVFFPPLVSSAVLVIVLVVLTGALHLDGLMDTCDALASGRSAKERLEIMRDSHIGSYGAIGGFSLLTLKYVTLGHLTGVKRIVGFTLMPVMGRWAMVYSIFVHPYARISGMGKAFKDGINLYKLLITTFISLALSLAIAWFLGLGVVVGVWVIAALWGSFLKAKFNGLTGDSYGAIAEVTEVAVPFLMLLLPESLLQGGIIAWLHSF